MKYEEPIMEYIVLERQDVITLSVDVGDGENVGGDWNS